MKENKKEIEGIMTNESIKKDGTVQFSTVEINEEQLEERKIQLAQCELMKDDTDIQLEEMLEQLDKRIPALMLDDTIAELEKDIKEGIIRQQKSKEGLEVIKNASSADMVLMKIKLATLIKMKKADIPMRDLRLQISNLRRRKEQIDSPDKQIKKLQKIVRTRTEEVPSTRVNPKTPTGVY